MELDICLNIKVLDTRLVLSEEEIKTYQEK
ncbi:hypothetical protein NIES4103_44830 [Nostoc sp. NIES-4103]|nr:hypothetical protein NIES4103_44830 [Nostoc sp. NIES-4103]